MECSCLEPGKYLAHALAFPPQVFHILAHRLRKRNAGKIKHRGENTSTLMLNTSILTREFKRLNFYTGIGKPDFKPIAEILDTVGVFFTTRIDEEIPSVKWCNL